MASSSSKRFTLTIARDESGRTILKSPGVGRWHEAPQVGEMARSGKSLGTLHVLGRAHALIVPEGVHGVVSEICSDSYDVAYGQALVILSDDLAGQPSDLPVETDNQMTDGSLVFSSSSSGRYYSRPSPDKPAFVNVGDEIEVGQTVFLLEVMKTFSRVAYAGEGLPERAKVLRILPTDGEDLEPGQAVLELEAL